MGWKPGGRPKTNIQPRIERDFGRTPLFDRLRKCGNGVHVSRADSETFFIQYSPRSLSGMLLSRYLVGLRSGVGDFGFRQNTGRRGDHDMVARDDANAGI